MLAWCNDAAAASVLVVDLSGYATRAVAEVYGTLDAVGCGVRVVQGMVDNCQSGQGKVRSPTVVGWGAGRSREDG
jgi:hypothetical protein